MSVVLKYLRESTLPIILVVILLIIKVFADLALPQYTSNIVNVGIQQGGLETLNPQALTLQTYNTLLKNLSEPEIIMLNQAYRYDETLYQQPAYVLKSQEEKLPPNLALALAKIGMGTSEFYSDKLVQQAALQQIRTEYEVLGISVAKLQNSYIGRTGLQMLGVSALSAIASIMVAFFASRSAAKLGKRLRSEVFHKVVGFSQNEMDGFSTASLVTRSTNDIQQIQQSFVMILRVVVFAPLMALGGLFQVLRTNVNISWTIALAIAAIFMVVIVMFTLAMPRFKKLQIFIDNSNRIVRETLTGLQVIRAFNTQKHEQKRFEKANTDLTNTSLFVNRLMSAMMPLMMLIMNLTTVLIVWKGSQQIQVGTMQVGDMMAFIQYAMMIIMAFLMITMLTIMLPRASVSANRIKEVLHTPTTLVAPENTLPFTDPVAGKIRFNNVSFAYPGAHSEAICEISFSAEPGSTTAIIGSTGSGKSTILNLIPRFHDVTSGSVTIDGVDIRQRNLKELRQLIGYVPQRGLLFSGTIASNIAYGDETITQNDIEWAASIAQATDFIEEKVDGYQNAIAQAGVNVSGGQRQRLSIARAIAHKPKILLFDDSFSALDYRTEHLVRQQLQNELSTTTILIVAQRISSILHADTILVLDEGRLVGQGTHFQLLKSCPVYQEIAQSQLSLEELASNE